MTVVNIYSGQPRPGRYEDALEMNRASRKVLESHGAKDHRIFVGTVSTAAYGLIINSCEFDDMETWGTFYDAVMVDEEVQHMLNQVKGENSPYATQTMSVASEIPLGRQRGPKGNVVSVYLSAPVPGRYPASLALGEQAFDLLERHGARNCRLFQQQANGLQPDVLAAIMEFDNMRAYGKAMDAFMSDPAGRSIVELTQSSDNPVRPISSDIYTEIAN